MKSYGLLQDDFDISLDEEKEEQTKLAVSRQEAFKYIISNQPSHVPWLNIIGNALGITLISVLPTIPYLLIPVHDLAKQPEYWHEIFFHGAIISADTCLFLSFTAGCCLNNQYSKNPRNILVFCFLGVLVSIFFLLATHAIWTTMMSLNYPISFLGQIMMLTL